MKRTNGIAVLCVFGQFLVATAGQESSPNATPTNPSTVKVEWKATIMQPDGNHIFVLNFGGYGDHLLKVNDETNGFKIVSTNQIPHPRLNSKGPQYDRTITLQKGNRVFTLTNHSSSVFIELPNDVAQQPAGSDSTNRADAVRGSLQQ